MATFTPLPLAVPLIAVPLFSGVPIAVLPVPLTGFSEKESEPFQRVRKPLFSDPVRVNSAASPVILSSTPEGPTVALAGLQPNLTEERSGTA